MFVLVIYSVISWKLKFDYNNDINKRVVKSSLYFDIFRIV